MTAMPIKAMRPPTAVASQPNGAVDPSLLEQVDEKTGYLWKMASLPARGMRAMRAEIHAKFGVWMTSVGRGRSFQTQYDTFLQRHNPVSKQVYDGLPATGAQRRYWPDAVRVYKLSSVYWALKKGFAAAAVPGTSPHGLWCADDMALPDDADADTSPEGITDRKDILEWMYANEQKYGFAHSLVSEPWHVQWIAADEVPTAVAAFEAQHPPEPTPVPPTPSTSEVTEMFLIKGSAPDVWLVVPHADSKKTRRVHVTPEQFDDDVIDFGTPRNVVDVNEWGKVAG